MSVKGKLAAFEYLENGEPLEPYFDVSETTDNETERGLVSDLILDEPEAMKNIKEYIEGLLKAKIRIEQLNNRWVGVEVLNRHLNRAERFNLATHVLTGLSFRTLWIGKRYQYGVYFRLDSEKRSKRKLKLENDVWIEAET